MSHRPRPGWPRRLEARLWTGSLAHLIGGGLDLAGAFATWLFARLRGRQVR